MIPMVSLDGIAQHGLSTLGDPTLWRVCGFTIEQIPTHAIANESISPSKTSFGHADDFWIRYRTKLLRPPVIRGRQKSWNDNRLKYIHRSDHAFHQ